MPFTADSAPYILPVNQRYQREMRGYLKVADSAGSAGGYSPLRRIEALRVSPATLLPSDVPRRSTTSSHPSAFGETAGFVVVASGGMLKLKPLKPGCAGL